MRILNIAAYKFVSIPEPVAWIAPLKERCHQLALKGTIILATEGINLFLAGEPAAIKSFLDYLSTNEIFGERFTNLETKESFSEWQPFKRMIVRMAKEIITMRHPTICPEATRAPSIDSKTLKQWLDQGHDDQGRQIILLDTRNAFEVEMGTFKNSLNLDIERFSEFPAAIKDSVENIPGGLKDKTIVSFCTGGIRCEKSVLYMRELNFPHVFQLEGGVLRYFEEVGSDHWQGECFVFDERITLDPQLQPSTKTVLSLT